MTVVEVGFVQTDMVDDLFDNEFVQASYQRYKRMGLSRMLTAEEVADAVAAAIAHERGEVRLPKRSAGLAVLANTPRSIGDLLQKGIPTR